jgi:transposase InsO family protein
MPLRERTIMSQREEFVERALAGGSVIRELCREFAVSPDTGYRWLKAYHANGVAGLADRSRRPRRSPGRTSPQVEAAVVALRLKHPTWGGRKVAAWLRAAGHDSVPAASTVTGILRRHGLLDPARAGQPRAFTRFEYTAPNLLWQMDFKGHVPCNAGGRCHPLTVLDDHSRYSIALVACADERRGTVRQALETAFRTYGLPEALLADNGPPWGDPTGGPYTRLGVWLLRLGVRLLHSRPHHP